MFYRVYILSFLPHHGVHAHRYEVFIRDKPWAQIALPIMSQGIGTPLGYIDRNGMAVANPKTNRLVDAQALIIMVDEEQKITEHELARCLGLQ